MEPLWIVLPGLLIWTSILLLPWRSWSTRESLEADPSLQLDLSQVTVLIPARNEAAFIGKTLAALASQGTELNIILIDDESTDETIATAEKQHLNNLTIIPGTPLVPGWSGKLWALEQGRQYVNTNHILLLDADISLTPGTIAALLLKAQQEKVQFVSLMAHLKMENFWERMLMPAFVYFFKLLYPFRISNSNSTLIAAAAGGCILIDRNALREIGGFGSLKDELIDDCALARRIKNKGYRTWTGLTHSAISLRDYANLKTIWDMVARTAFTQLKYSVILLLFCTLLMLAAFVLPVLSLLMQDAMIRFLSISSLVLMGISYFPTLKYYGLSPVWIVTLPVIGILYLLMTWSSAFNYWRGTGALWKDRFYTGQTG